MIAQKIEANPLFGKGAEIRLYIQDLKAVQDFMNKYVDGKEYVVDIKQKRAKRSLDANAYAWVLCKKIADVLGSTDKEVYKISIRNYGVSDIRPIKEDVADKFCRMWDAQGIGNQHHIIGKSKHDGYVNIKFYWGSSQYDTADMARLIDGIIQDAKDLNIETMTPDEIARMKAAWS